MYARHNNGHQSWLETLWSGFITVFQQMRQSTYNWNLQRDISLCFLHTTVIYIPQCQVCSAQNLRTIVLAMWYHMASAYRFFTPGSWPTCLHAWHNSGWRSCLRHPLPQYYIWYKWQEFENNCMSALLSGKPRSVFPSETSYHKMFWSLKLVGLEDMMFVSLANLTGNLNTDKCFQSDFTADISCLPFDIPRDLYPILLAWFNLNPGMDKKLHPL